MKRRERRRQGRRVCSEEKEQHTPHSNRTAVMLGVILQDTMMVVMRSGATQQLLPTHLLFSINLQQPIHLLVTHLLQLTELLQPTLTPFTHLLQSANLPSTKLVVLVLCGVETCPLPPPITTVMVVLLLVKMEVRHIHHQSLSRVLP
ncbi:hypothetical protein Pcinc_013208 [Petrolisthes cinctipes]|uniref:Uncharacterized protein n=1 Tax=Petrolisthes cinctipes TaxID=88211 RepID=A0AAE1KRT8_PETCI|nr:hypothetical protein Pcinc_013208 [Petrolisthes cinctipes]